MPSFRSRITSNLNAASSSGLAFRVGTESNYRIDIDAGGTINWGPGGATAVDTNLYRSAAGILKTDDIFQAVGGVVTSTSAGTPSASLSDGGLSVDTTNSILYFRSGAAWVKTIDTAVTNADLATATGELGGAWNSDSTTSGFTNVSSGTFQRRWVLIGKTLHFRGWFTAGTATAGGSVAITLPGSYTAITGRNQVLYGVNTATIVTVVVTNNTGTVSIYSSNAGGTFTAGAALSNLTIQGTIQVT